MNNDGSVTQITATLGVTNGPAATAFYQAAFGASVLHAVPDGGVAQLAVDGAEFWIAEASPEHENFSPRELGGCSVRLLLICADPAAVCKRAITAGAKLVYAPVESHGWLLGRIEDPDGHHWEIGRRLH